MPLFNGRQFEWEITAGDIPNSIKSFLQDKQFSRRGLANLRSKGIILINNEQVELNHWLQAGEHLLICLPEIISESMHPVNAPLDILYEDEFLLIVNKPAGLLTIPSKLENTDSLAQRILGFYQQKEIASTIHIVTRLDKDTSGLVLVAKDRHTQYLLSREKIVRIYHAVVCGCPDADFVIEQPIRKCADSIIKREVHQDGQFARTHGRVLSANSRYALVELFLDTGRTHQIRVHMASIGHPLLGDSLYGGEPMDNGGEQILHAKELRFTHPYTGQELVVIAEYPRQFQEALELITE